MHCHCVYSGCCVAPWTVILAAHIINNRYLNRHDSDFVDLVISDLTDFLPQVTVDRVLIFPAVENRYRFLIHKTVEDFPQLGSFSVGEGPQRRTVVCLRESLRRGPKGQDLMMNSHQDRPASSKGRGRGQRRETNSPLAARPGIVQGVSEPRHQQQPCANDEVKQPEQKQHRPSRLTGKGRVRPRRPEQQLYVPRALRSKQDHAPVSKEPEKHKESVFCDAVAETENRDMLESMCCENSEQSTEGSGKHTSAKVTERLSGAAERLQDCFTNQQEERHAVRENDGETDSSHRGANESVCAEVTTDQSDDRVSYSSSCNRREMEPAAKSGERTKTKKKKRETENRDMLESVCSESSKRLAEGSGKHTSSEGTTDQSEDRYSSSRSCDRREMETAAKSGKRTKRKKKKKKKATRSTEDTLHTEVTSDSSSVSSEKRDSETPPRNARDTGHMEVSSDRVSLSCERKALETPPSIAGDTGFYTVSCEKRDLETLPSSAGDTGLLKVSSDSVSEGKVLQIEQSSDSVSVGTMIQGPRELGHMEQSSGSVSVGTVLQGPGDTVHMEQSSDSVSVGTMLQGPRELGHMEQSSDSVSVGTMLQGPGDTVHMEQSSSSVSVVTMLQGPGDTVHMEQSSGSVSVGTMLQGPGDTVHMEQSSGSVSVGTMLQGPGDTVHMEQSSGSVSVGTMLQGSGELGHMEQSSGSVSVGTVLQGPGDTVHMEQSSDSVSVGTMLQGPRELGHMEQSSDSVSVGTMLQGPGDTVHMEQSSSSVSVGTMLQSPGDTVHMEQSSVSVGTMLQGPGDTVHMEQSSGSVSVGTMLQGPGDTVHMEQSSGSVSVGTMLQGSGDTASVEVSPDTPAEASGGSEGSEGDGDDDDSWDKLFDDNGDCLDSSVMEELSSFVGEVEITKPKKTINYLEFTPKEPDLDMLAYSHVIEISDFPVAFQTADLMVAFKDYQKRGFDIKWVDDSRALGIFSSAIAADEALKMIHPMMKLKPLSEASKQSRVKAKRCQGECLQPYKPRPQMSTMAAKRLVSHALGISAPRMSKEKRDEERRVLKEAREKKRKDRRQKDDMWNGEIAGCAMDNC